MAVTTDKMICLRCGVEMNHHCDKVMLASKEGGPIDPALGGTLEEFHTCPKCGDTASRHG